MPRLNTPRFEGGSVGEYDSVGAAHLSVGAGGAIWSCARAACLSMTTVQEGASIERDDRHAREGAGPSVAVRREVTGAKDPVKHGWPGR